MITKIVKPEKNILPMALYFLFFFFFFFQQEFYFVCNRDYLEDHLMGELSLAEAEDVLHISLKHGGIGVLGNHLQNVFVDGSLIGLALL